MSLHLLSPDEEADLLNHIAGLIDQLKLNKRVPSEWNKKMLNDRIHELDTDLSKYHARMKRAEEKIKKAS